MTKDIDELLNKLEPIIDNKCDEIKSKKIQKKENILMTLLCLLFLTIPIILLILNISIVYFIFLILIIISLRLFIKLPDILNKDLKGACYE